MSKLADYRFKKTRDIRGAVALGLARFLSDREYALPRSTKPFKLAKIYDRWASFNDLATGDGNLPAAAVLADRATYTEEFLTPNILEHTWSGGDPTECGDPPKCKQLYPYGDGTGRGWALVETSEVTVPLVLVVRTLSYESRRAIFATLEELFVEAGHLPDPAAFDRGIDPGHPEIPRYGVRLTLPEYYERSCLYTLKSSAAPESDRASRENRWEAIFELDATLTACGVVPLVAHRGQVRVVVDGEPGDEP